VHIDHRPARFALRTVEPALNLQPVMRFPAEIFGGGQVGGGQAGATPDAGQAFEADGVKVRYGEAHRVGWLPGTGELPDPFAIPQRSDRLEIARFGIEQPFCARVWVQQAGARARFPYFEQNNLFAAERHIGVSNVPGRVVHQPAHARNLVSQRPDSNAAVGVGVRHHQHTAAVGNHLPNCLDPIAQVQDFAVVLAVDVGQPDLPPAGCRSQRV